MGQKPSLWHFTLAFREHLFAAMSGGASVPFTALAVYLDNKWAQGIFLACALTCAWFAAYRVWRTEREKVLEFENKNNVDEFYPNIRIATSVPIHQIMSGPDRSKFLALLTAGKLNSWARPMIGRVDFVRLSGEMWESHFVDVCLNIEIDETHKVRHQTFFRTKLRREATHYDVNMNCAQMKRVWPNLPLEKTAEDGA